jgi:hypothetical protein
MTFKSFSVKNLKKPKLFALVAMFFALVVSIPLLPLPVLSANSSAKIQFVSPNWVAENAGGFHSLNSNRRKNETFTIIRSFFCS